MSFSANKPPVTAAQMTVRPPEATAQQYDQWDMPRDIDPASGIVRTVEGQERAVRADDRVTPKLASVAVQGAGVGLQG